DQPFTGFLDTVRETTLEAFANGDVPFDRVVDEVQPERDPSRTPLVQAVVILQQPMVRPREIGELRVGEYDLPRPCARFDLVVEFWPREGGLTVAVEHNTDLFDAVTVERLIRSLEVLLTGIAERPDRTVGELPLLTGEDHRFLLQTATAAVEPAGTVPGLFDAQAARQPGAAAVTCGEVRLTYRELQRKADGLAARLVRLGVRPEDRVGVLMDRSADLVVAVLAILKSGGAYLPVDLRAPADRMRLILGGTSILVTDDRWYETATTVHSGQTLVVADEPGEAPEVLLQPDNLAYVEYTSGSTGVPKGVAVRHADVVTLAADSRFTGGAHERVLMHSPLAFDASTYELWVPLLNGGEVVVAPAGDLDADVLHHQITEHGVTAIWLTAGLFRLFAQETPECFAGLREVWTGGDVVPPEAARRVLDRCRGLSVVDGYGPTETTTFATSYRMRASVPDLVPIGKPLDGMRILILDARLRPVPHGAVGEIHIAGTGLARGYFGRPGATAERFVANPFGVPGERMYRTGDLGRWRSDGTIEFAGRTDDQVKIRGFRVEPAEIERALTARPEVRQAVVAVRSHNDRKQLTAYVVPSDVDIAELRRELGRTLPDYLVPSAIVALPELPLNANGKVDRHALPEPRFDTTAAQLAPRTEREAVLAGIWAEVLGVERVGVDDNFFSLGGDSILSIQVSARARRAGFAMTAGDLFRHQTIAALAASITETGDGPVPGPVSGDVALTPIQRWFFETSSVPEHFDQVLELELTEDVGEVALTAALSALAEHHDALRMEFQYDDNDQWYQYNAAIGEGESRLCWSLSGRILRLAAHHLVVDGVSWRILLEDLDRAYHQVVRGESIDLGPRSTSFQEWAAKFTEFATAGGFDDELDHWRGLDADRAIPVDGSAPNMVGATRSVTVRLSPDETSALLRDVPAV
ncbi:MAG TPA: amino acid adenylation domain-containing protein, partial [Amycolatopsis sp.]|nr:amino acid adenylation domain-containing protein [Amycolatopsis sp.]